MTLWTEDCFFNGAIRIRQQRNGYRFSIDALLAASGVEPKAGDTVLDLGTGCGIIPLILGFRYTDLRIVGVEIQKELAELARFNCRQNGLEDRFDIIHTDMRELHPTRFERPVDWVVCNPPYRRPSSGRMNPDMQRAVARHEIQVNLAQIVKTATKMLAIGGRLVMIYPAERLAEIVNEMRSCKIEPKSMQPIYSRMDENAKLVLIKGIKGGRPGLVVKPPLYIYDTNGSYSARVEALMQP